MGSGSASRIDDPNAAKTYRLEFAYAFVRRESEQNSSLQLLQVCGSRRKTAPIISRWTERADALTAVGLRSDGYVSSISHRICEAPIAAPRQTIGSLGTCCL
jgi:hypothetical protein